MCVVFSTGFSWIRGHRTLVITNEYLNTTRTCNFIHEFVSRFANVADLPKNGGRYVRSTFDHRKRCWTYQGWSNVSRIGSVSKLDVAFKGKTTKFILNKTILVIIRHSWNVEGAKKKKRKQSCGCLSLRVLLNRRRRANKTEKLVCVKGCWRKWIGNGSTEGGRLHRISLAPSLISSKRTAAGAILFFSTPKIEERFWWK